MHALLHADNSTHWAAGGQSTGQLVRTQPHTSWPSCQLSDVVATVTLHCKEEAEKNRVGACPVREP